MMYIYTGAIGGGVIATIVIASLVIMCIVIGLFRKSARQRANKGTCIKFTITSMNVRYTHCNHPFSLTLCASY